MLKKQIIFFLYLSTILFVLAWLVFNGDLVSASSQTGTLINKLPSSVLQTFTFFSLLILHMILLHHAICAKLELANCFTLQSWFLFTILVLIKFNSRLDALIVWIIFSIFLLLFFNLKEKEKIFGNTLLAGIISGASVLLFPEGWMFTFASLGMMAIWAILTPRTLFIFMIGWISVFLYLSVFFFLTDQFSADRIIELMHVPAINLDMSFLKILGAVFLSLLFFGMFFSFVEYRISTRKMYLCLMLFYLIPMTAFLFGAIEMITVALYPFWIVLSKFLQNNERRWYWWPGSLIPLLGFIYFIFFF